MAIPKLFEYSRWREPEIEPDFTCCFYPFYTIAFKFLAEKSFKPLIFSWVFLKRLDKVIVIDYNSIYVELSS